MRQRGRWRAARRGFTLVEILIVVIILGILASIVIPKFANASVEAKKNSLASTLQALRGQIELYMLQHGDQTPALTAADWTPLTDQSTYSGQTVGPYLNSAPMNPLNGHSDVTTVTADQVGGTAVSGTNIGFVYNTTNGKLWATNTAGTKVFNEVDPNDPNN
ncbi:MAG TPA: prepilin-type N-terminal cleavage/methylation domain-containing protein [Tepidisphaeraceae bacterium]